MVLPLDFLALSEDGGGTTEIDVGGSEIVEALVIASVVVKVTKASTWHSSSPGK
jgi:hypothetical protein